MLKAPPVNPLFYISRFYNIDLTEGRYFVQKYVRKGPSHGGLEVERWSDNRTDSASVGSNPV